MALRQQNAVKRAAAATSLTLLAHTGEAFRIRRIYCAGSGTSPDYLTVKAERRTVGFYRVAGKSGNHLFFPGYRQSYNLMEWLAANNIDVSIPIAEGESLTITSAGTLTFLAVVYDIYDAADVKNTERNGSASGEIAWVQYMTYNTAITASGEVELDTLLSPKDFQNFPVGQVVPSNYEILLAAIIGAPADVGASSANVGLTTLLRLVKNGDSLFDEDSGGLTFRGAAATTTGITYLGNISLVGSAADVTFGEPLKLNPPLMFREGDELNVNVNVSFVSGSFTAAAIDLALLLVSKRLK
jgi:hypothetical protein